jgi:hypothetical protein
VTRTRAHLAQEEYGFLLAAGIGTPVDTAASVLYHFFAASANRTAAQMALGCASLVLALACLLALCATRPFQPCVPAL